MAFGISVFLFGLLMTIPAYGEISSFGKDSDISHDLHNANIVRLNLTNHEDVLMRDDSSIVLFYVEWCGYCKDIMSKYKIAAQELSKKGLNLYTVDCDENEDLCSQYQINGYPDLRVFEKGKHIRVYPFKDEKQLAKFVIKTNSPINSVIDNEVDLHVFLNSTELAFVGVFDSKNEDVGRIYDRFVSDNLDMAEMKRVTFDLSHVYKSVTPPCVFSITSDGSINILGGEITSESLDRFVKIESLNAVGEIDASTYGSYIDTNLPLSYVFYTKIEDKTRLKRELEPVFKKFKYDVASGFINGTTYHVQGKYLGLESESMPAVIIHNPKSDEKFIFKQIGKSTKNDIESFYKRVLDGTERPFYKSAPIPTNNNDEFVFSLVHDNFQDVVFDNRKDVLVEFHSDYLQQCKRIAPLYEQLAKVYSRCRDKLVIATFDLEENDIPKHLRESLHEIHPSHIVLFPAARKENPIQFYDDISLKNISDFITKYASHDLVPDKSLLSFDDNIHDDTSYYHDDL